MRIYHGSYNDFNEFEINEKYSNQAVKTLSEGLGIYMTTDMGVVEDYGNIIYTVELEEDDYFDATNKREIRKLIKTISKKVDLNIGYYSDIETLINSIIDCRVSVIGLPRELQLQLDSEFKFYDDYGHLVTYNEDCIFERIERAFFETIPDIIKLNDNSYTEPIYICFRNPENLNIVDKRYL